MKINVRASLQTAASKAVPLSSAQLMDPEADNTNWFTPQPIIEAARAVLGTIDLDPASCAIANERVRASVYYDKHGLFQPWFGLMWMNHPFSRLNNSLWIRKLVDVYVRHEIIAACCITYASTSEEWFRPLLQFPQCFLHGRTNYILPSGAQSRGVQKGSVVTYLGTDLRAFVQVFKKLGTVKIVAGVLATNNDWRTSG